MPTSTMEERAIVDVPDRYGITRMYRVSWGGDERAVAFLLAKGANIDLPDRDGHTMLQCASARADADWTELLLSHGAAS